MERKERIKVLKGIVIRWNNSLAIQKNNKKHYKLYKEDIDRQDEEIQALQETIADLELLDKVASEGVNKMPIWDATDKGKMPIGLKLHSEGFNEAIDLCNAHFVERIKGIEGIVDKAIRCRVEEDDGEEILYPTHSLKMNITQALITHLTHGKAE